VGGLGGGVFFPFFFFGGGGGGGEKSHTREGYLAKPTWKSFRTGLVNDIAKTFFLCQTATKTCYNAASQPNAQKHAWRDLDIQGYSK